MGIYVENISWNGYTYTGETSDGYIPCGKGKITYPNGAVWEGEFKNGLLNGLGTKTFGNGRLSEEGEFKNGRLNGQGRRVYYDCRILRQFEEGIFKNGDFVSGKETCHDGTTREGNFKRGIYRILTLPNGDVYKIRKNGWLVLEGDCKNGTGKRISSYGTIEEGEEKVILE